MTAPPEAAIVRTGWKAVVQANTDQWTEGLFTRSRSCNRREGRDLPYLLVSLALSASLQAAPEPSALPAAPPAERARALPSGPIFTEADYPKQAADNREEGIVGFRLTIGPSGRIADCTILRSSGSALLDQATCRLLVKRARFKPARDEEGKVTFDSIEREMEWKLPTR